MTTCRDVSSAAGAARTATVLPAPTSPVITPRACCSMHQPIRATASAWVPWRCSIEGASGRPNGILVKPQWPADAGYSPAGLLPQLAGALILGEVVDGGLPG